MEVNVAALVVLICFYLVILVVGVLAARWKGHTGQPSLESSIVADRNIPTSVGIFTMTGGLVYAGPMRERNYMTMLDPFYERFGSVVVFLVYLASLVGDLFWTASILIALVTSAGVTVAYTMVGQMISVAYTDVVQLFFIMFGLALSIPFVLTNEHVGSIKATSDVWVGELPSSAVLPWIDLFIAMTFGTIPWQSYMQRVLSVKGKRQAQVLSVVGGCLSLILVVPSIIIGAASTSADWKATSLGVSPLDADKSSMVLPYVLNEFTPKAVSILGLGAISAAVMSSMDSSILGSSSMFTYNIYRQIFRPQASPVELLWAQRLAILVLGVVATGISLHVPIIYGLFVMAGDIVFVIVLPQLTCALFVPMSNGYGAVCGYVLGIVLRIGAGEPFLNLDPYIRYPSYSETDGQVFPFRVFTVCCTFITMIGVSFVANILFRKDILPEYFDILRNFKREAGGSSASLGLDQHHPVVKSFHENPSYRVSTHM
ncbi:SC5A7-like protein [Mya arenaria]|uniref:SC5A7-like protein n=1 Tax=Mya arenaria TaxID=6604 RepID=A0ABY7ED24_MYAAR|nr:SC5A7-like protein [Mya arenaria]